MTQYLGLVLILLSWIGGFYLFSKLYDKDLSTISKHAASNKRATLIFSTVLIPLGLGFLYWLLVWLKPHLGLGVIFEVTAIATIICLLVAAVVPDIAGRQRRVHSVAAYGMAALYVPLSVCIILSDQLSVGVQVICSALLLYMVTGIILVAVLRKATKHYLQYQASYIVAFQLILLIAAYS